LLRGLLLVHAGSDFVYRVSAWPISAFNRSLFLQRLHELHNWPLQLGCRLVKLRQLQCGILLCVVRVELL